MRISSVSEPYIYIYIMMNKHMFVLYISNRMDIYVRPSVLCRLITTIIRQIKKDIVEIEKIENINVVLMLNYVYVIVIYDGMCVKDMLNILCEDVFLIIMKT